MAIAVGLTTTRRAATRGRSAGPVDACVSRQTRRCRTGRSPRNDYAVLQAQSLTLFRGEGHHTQERCSGAAQVIHDRDDLVDGSEVFPIRRLPDDFFKEWKLVQVRGSVPESRRLTGDVITYRLPRNVR